MDLALSGSKLKYGINTLTYFQKSSRVESVMPAGCSSLEEQPVAAIIKAMMPKYNLPMRISSWS